MVGAILLVTAFAAGAVPFGYLIGRAAGVDIRRVGSGNIGAGNLLRTLGWPAALLTLLLDASKGALPVAVARWGGLPSEWQAGLVAAAVLGHVYTPFLGFRGGKGVATTLGGLVAASPWVAATSAGIWVVIAAASRFASLAALVAAAVLPVITWWLDDRAGLVPLAVLLAALVVWRHRGNMVRLVRGTEPRIGHRVSVAPQPPSA